MNRCLSDEIWLEFQPIAGMTGFEKLAVVSTRTCELFLVLPERKWCVGADQRVCELLMEYVLASGNFGRKQAEDSRVSAHFLFSTCTWKGIL